MPCYEGQILRQYPREGKALGLGRYVPSCLALIKPIQTSTPVNNYYMCIYIYTFLFLLIFFPNIHSGRCLYSRSGRCLYSSCCLYSSMDLTSLSMYLVLPSCSVYSNDSKLWVCTLRMIVNITLVLSQLLGQVVDQRAHVSSVIMTLLTIWYNNNYYYSYYSPECCKYTICINFRVSEPNILPYRFISVQHFRSSDRNGGC